MLLRVGFAAHLSSQAPYADAADYDRTAVSLVLHGQYPPSTVAPSGGPSAFRAPAYPYLLAAAYELTGTVRSAHRFVVARMLSALLSTGIVALVTLIGYLLWGWSLSTAAAGILAAVFPTLVTIGDAALSEPLFTVFVLSAVVTVLLERRSRRMLWTIATGILVALAALTRSNGIIILIPIAAGIWTRPRFTRAALARVIAMVAVVGLVMAPWAIRNTLAFHQFVPITSQDGFTLAGTYNDVSLSSSQNPAGFIVPTMAPYNRLRAPHESEATINDHFRSAVISFIGRHPSYVAKVAYFNLGRLMELQGLAYEHSPAREVGISNRISDVNVYAFYLLELLVAAAVVLGALRRAPGFLWGAPAAIAVSLIFVLADNRYRFPLDPFLVLVVAAGIGSNRWRRSIPG